ncbi:sensor histidine kinase [Pseudonocardia sp.]|uniref:sensor histidine kinase n=1 Tax=Pseudonocardia sp. TaxID=60912 RepID=UPI003D10718F
MRVGLLVASLTGAGAALAAAATMAHAVVSPAPEAGVAQAAMLGAPVLASALAGWVIAVRAPGNRVGGLLLVNACVLALYGAALHVRGQGLATASDAPTAPLTAWAALWVHSGWPTFFAGLVALAFLFPDGRLPSPRWRPVAAAIALYIGGYLVLAAFDPRPYSPPFGALPKPLPVADVAEAVLVGDCLILATVLVAVAAVVARYRGSSGLARVQLRWFALAAVLVPATWVVCTVEFVVTGAVGEWTFLATSVTLIAVVAAVTVAVLRHRLYEIDVLINRTAVYAVLTGLLAVVYASIALVAGVAVGTGSRWTTAAATLAVALAFRPLRARVQRVVDRRFDRDRFVGLRRAERFLADVRAGRAEPEQVGRVLADAVGDDGVELYYRLPDGASSDGPGFADADGTEHRELPADGRERTPVRSGAQLLGVVLHPPSERPALLREVLETLGLAIEIARLRVEVRRQLARVRDSRARIVAATYAERRRIERNLHDGAQQRLVSVGLTLRHVQHRLCPTGGDAALLDGAVAEVGAAIEELRELARGLGPAVLDRGLATALADLAARAPLPVHVDAAVERLPGDVEAAAYFLASEALTNVVKHANATAVSLSAGRENGRLRIVVIDDGVGCAGLRPGSGLAGLADRVDALGGRLEIDSAPGEGTRVAAELPCG